MRRQILLTVILCAATAPITLAKQLDTVRWNDRAGWNCVNTLDVRPFSVSGEFKGPKSEEEYMQHFVTQLTSRLVRPGGLDKVTLRDRDEAIEADAVLTGDWAELSVGSRAARFWVGYGAGTAKADLRARIYRGDERSEIVNFQHARVSPFSLSGDANIGDIDAVVADIGEELLRRRATCDPAQVKTVVVQPATASSQEAAESYGQVNIESNVANAEVLIGGKFVGNAPLVGYRLPPGDHDIEVVAPGYQVWKRTLTVTTGSPTRIVASLDASPK